MRSPGAASGGQPSSSFWQIQGCPASSRSCSPGFSRIVWIGSKLELEVQDTLENRGVAAIGPAELQAHVPAHRTEFELDGRSEGMLLVVRRRKASERPKISERLETQPDRRAGKPVEPVLIAEPHARGVVEHPFPDRVQPDHEVLAPFFQKELPLDFVPMLVLTSWECVLDVQGDRGPGIPLVEEPVDCLEPILDERELLAAALHGLFEV